MNKARVCSRALVDLVILVSCSTPTLVGIAAEDEQEGPGAT